MDVRCLRRGGLLDLLRDLGDRARPLSPPLLSLLSFLLSSYPENVCLVYQGSLTYPKVQGVVVSQRIITAASLAGVILVTLP